MSSFVIEGGYRLSGEIVPQGAKNEALQVICATLLTPEKVTIHNVPDILDVNNLIQLLRDMQVKVEHPAANTYTFQADAVDLNYLETDEFLRKRSLSREAIRSDAVVWILTLSVFRSWGLASVMILTASSTK